VLQPLPNYVLLEPYKEQKKKSAIILPDNTDEKKSEKGKVVAIVPNKANIKKGDVVFFKKYSEQKITHQDKEYLIVKYEDILAVVN